MKQLVWLVVAATMFAGCSGSEEATAPEPCDELTSFVDAEGVCVLHTEPTIIVTGIPETVEQFTAVTFTWALDNGTRQTLHSMENRILVSATDMNVTNETGPDAWGTQIARETHKDLPENFTATFVWDNAETVYIKGYMEINAKHVWVDLGSIDVTAVTASGQRTTITVSGMPPAVDDSEVGITVGDGVTFDNQLQFELALTWSCTNGASPDDSTIAAGTTLNVDFTALTSCNYTLNTPLAATGTDPGEVTGKVIVSRP